MKQRMINTRFWSDSWVVNLDPIEKLLFLYLLTNERTNISGVYELPIKYMAVETGIEKEMIVKILDRFSKDGKIKFVNGWVIIKNFHKHQNSNSPKVKMGIDIELSKIPASILQEMDKDIPSTYHIDTISHPNLNPNSNSNLNSNPKIATPLQEVVNHFFLLKGWNTEEKSKVVYARFVRPAKDLLELCESDVNEAKDCLSKVSEWAKSRDLEWSIETVFKKWYEIDALKPKDKKPHYDGCRIFQKVKGGKWWIIRNGDIKELGVIPKKDEIKWM